MSKAAKLQIARPGYDRRDITDDKNFAYTSERITPKLSNSLDTTNNFESFNHNLGYIPMFWPIRNIDGTKYSHGIQDYTMSRNIKADPISLGYTDSNVFGVIKATGTEYTPPYSPYEDTGICGFMFLDPLYDQDVPPPTIDTKPKVLIAQQGKDIRKIGPKDMSLDSRFDTLRIYKTGLITISAPAETISSSKTYSGSYTHGLGYVPFYAPFCPYKNNLAKIYYPNSVPSTVVVNDFEGSSLFFRGISVPPGNEDVNVYITNDTINVDYIRNPSGSTSFSAKTINCYYTIFINRVDENMNLLN